MNWKIEYSALLISTSLHVVGLAGWYGLGSPTQPDKAKQFGRPGPSSHVQVELDRKVLTKFRPSGHGVALPDSQTNQGKVFHELRQVEKAPQVIDSTSLVSWLAEFYPKAKRLAGEEATVKLEIALDENGKVYRITLLKSAGPEFDRAAQKVVRALEFTPGQVSGQNVAVLFRLNIPFRLQ